MEKPHDLMQLLEECAPRFSKGQRRIAQYIKADYDQAAFMTAAKLGQTVGVSESTVVRFATEVGFDGYPQLQRELRELIRNRLTSVQRMEVIDRRMLGNDVLNEVMHSDMEAIRKSLDEVHPASFQAAVKTIINARKIYIIGIRSAAALASFLDYYFTHMFENARNVDTASTSVIFEQMLRIGPEDVFIGITFSRYSRRTYKAASFAKANGAKVIAITDSTAAPIAQIADYVLVAKSEMAGIVDSLVAPLSLINALIVAIGLEKKEEIKETYDRLEKIWSDFSVYSIDRTDAENERQFDADED